MAEVKKEKASINGIELEVQTLSDSFQASIVEHEYPHKHGADLEDMGESARTIRLRCFFYDDNYEDHKKLLALLKQQNLAELYHPRYGLINGKIKTIDINDDTISEQSAEIDISFVENMRGNIEPKQVDDIADKTEATLESGIEEQRTEFGNDIEESLGPDGKSLPSAVLDDEKTLLEQFSGLTAPVRAYVSELDVIIAKMDATLNEIANPANSLISTIDFGTNLPGRVLKSTTEMVERYTILYESAENSPGQFVESMQDGLTELENTLGLNDTDISTPKISEAKAEARNTVAKHLRITGALVTAQVVGRIYANDEKERQYVRRAEGVMGFDIEGNYIKPEITPEILTINQIEKSLAKIREYLQTAIDESREIQSLKDMARSLLQHANSIKLEREKIIQVEIENITPLHLICLMYGLAYNYAPRILSINPQIQNPNFVTGTVSIYVR